MCGCVVKFARSYVRVFRCENIHIRMFERECACVSMKEKEEGTTFIGCAESLKNVSK